MEEAVDEATDLRNEEFTKEWRERLNSPPGKEEVVSQMKLMRDAAPGEDGVRLSYLLKGGDAVVDEVVRIVRFMFEEEDEKWEDALRAGVVVPLYKMKGSRDDPNNYRGVCLLSLGSRILARILAVRLSAWAEAVGVLDDDQQGFRKGRSTADASQMMWRLREDAADLERRREGKEVDDKDKLTARLLDLRKAYPRVNKPALWRPLERYGLNGNFLRSLKGMHETTEYKVRGKMGFSEPWVPDRGLREGCPSSPPLFNIYHQAVMRLAAKLREKRAVERGLMAGIEIKWVPGSAFPCEKTWEKENSEAIVIKMDKSLFADDTTVVGNVEEVEQGVETTKEVMGRFEEKNNEDKEEVLMFAEEDSGQIRMLGSWMDWAADVKKRLERGSKAWFKTRKRLVGARISRRTQARVIEASVEATLLFDCQARVWRVGELKRLQKFVDKAYRYVWSSKKEPPLIQMQREGVNMADIRKELGVKSIRWKVEKRVLERIGHVMRMSDERMVKAVVLGWVEQLERLDRVSGSRRKTVLYWKRLLREAGIDWTNIGALTKDRKAWKEIVRKRMDWLLKWDWSKGKRWDGEEMERVQRKEEEFVFVCEVCRKVCRSKGGLTIHRKRIHEISDKKKWFKCEICLEVFAQQANLKNHKKLCKVGGGLVGEKRTCDICGKGYAKKSFAAHRRRCLAVRGVEEEEEGAQE